MKTIKQWLKECLSKEDYKKAERYENGYWRIERESFESALAYSFDWIETEEGGDYWSEIHKNGGSLQNNNTVMKTIKQWFKRIIKGRRNN